MHKPVDKLNETPNRIINVFSKPYRKWRKRRTTHNEMMAMVRNGVPPLDAFEVDDVLIAEISNHYQAALYMMNIKADNGLEHHIDQALAQSHEYQLIRKLMPPDVPAALEEYQSCYTIEGLIEADEAIKEHGVTLAAGQTLFHGGLWGSDKKTITTGRPFSTSFCPQVAMRNGEWSGKAFNNGRLDLMVVRVEQPKTKAYVYCTEGSHGNEKEVVFESGAELTIIKEVKIGDITAYKYSDSLQAIEKQISAYVLEVQLI